VRAREVEQERDNVLESKCKHRNKRLDGIKNDQIG
jgi:hypothetical protein